jgi:hypothetical protein
VSALLAAIAPPTDQWGYVAAGWAIIGIALVVYVVLLLRKGRQLSRQVPSEDRRWMS